MIEVTEGGEQVYEETLKDQGCSDPWERQQQGDDWFMHVNTQGYCGRRFSLVVFWAKIG